MAGKQSNVSSVLIAIFLILIVAMTGIILQAETGLISKHKTIFIIIGLVIVATVLIVLIVRSVIKGQRKKLLREVLAEMKLENIDSQVSKYDDRVTVKSKQALDNYSPIKYLREKNVLEKVAAKSEIRKTIKERIQLFLKSNDYEKRLQYGYVRNQLEEYSYLADGYRVRVVYITSAGNNRGERIIHLTGDDVDELVAHPEYLMTKGEYNRAIKQQKKEVLEIKKSVLYDRVNEIIDFANKSKETLIIKKQSKNLDDLVQKLFDRTVNSIQKVSKIESDEWSMIETFIDSIDNQIHEIVQKDKKISDYYASDEFAKIKETCTLLTQSQKEFNDYINEKAQAITQLFGTRVVRNETQNEDVFNYVRAYKKSITPFTAEVSSAVFGSAENNPIGYVIKYFYPNKSQYATQIEKLRVLIEELETLKDAKQIIDNYKKEYDQYIKNVPDYVLDNDESGFYSRLGLAIIDESVLNVEYKFTYTSDGGMAQRSFTIPMNEENITELIHQLEEKLSSEALVKEQRALMTTKLRNKIKERDRYTCCQCGNSVFAEPNLLLEIDHIIPVSKGGLTQEDNLQTLCWKCNRNKGAKLIV